MSMSQADAIAALKAGGVSGIDEFLAGQIGVETKNDTGPSENVKPQKPTAIATTNVGPTPEVRESTSDLKQVEGTSRPTDRTASSILEIGSRVVFSKEVEHEVSTFVPSSNRMYRILHEMDSILIQNRYFRQAIPSFLTTQSRIYCGILYVMQVARCMDDAGILSGAGNRQTFNEFFRNHPVATLPVPGPILPVLQALCISSPQDSTLPRVCPRLPADLGPARADQLIGSAANYAIPNLPMLFGLHERLRHVIVVQGQPLQTAEAVFNYFGYEGDASTQIVTINGANFPVGFQGLQGDALWAATSPGIGEPLELNDELLSSFRSNNRIVKFPVINAGNSLRTLSEFTRVLTGAWFSTLKRNMAVYCSYVKGSGTMQDVSVKGPAAAQIVSGVSTVGIVAPTGFFNQQALLPGDAAYRTTQSANDRMAELTTVYSQIHVRIQGHLNPTHNEVGQDDANTGRDGTFWDIRPLRPETNSDRVKDSLAEEIAFYIRERAGKD